MTVWADVAIPLGSAMFGGLVGGGSAIVTQIVTHRGTSAREREARYDAFKVKRFEIERETLLGLQDTVHRMSELLALVRQNLPQPPGRPAAGPGFIELQGQLIRLASRTLARPAADAALHYGVVATGTYQSPDLRHGIPPPELTKAWIEAMELIGAAIRKDPFAERD